jgi:hypothetical protein
MSPSLLDGWSGIPVTRFLEHITATMPPMTAGELTPGQYVDIIAYILLMNGAPPGESELPSDQAELEKILMRHSSAN